MIIRIHAYCSVFLKKKKYELWRKIQSDLNFAPQKIRKKKIKCNIMIHHCLQKHCNSNKLCQYLHYQTISHNSSVISLETTSNTIPPYRFWAWIKYPFVEYIKTTDPPHVHVHVYWGVLMTFSNFYISLPLNMYLIKH